MHIANVITTRRQFNLLRGHFSRKANIFVSSPTTPTPPYPTIRTLIIFFFTSPPATTEYDVRACTGMFPSHPAR